MLSFAKSRKRTMFSHLPKHNRIAVAAIALAAVVASVWQLAMSATDSAQLNLLGSVAASVDVTVAGTVEAGGQIGRAHV